MTPPSAIAHYKIIRKLGETLCLSAFISLTPKTTSYLVGCP